MPRCNPTKILVEDILPAETDQTTKGGIIIPGSVASKQPSMKARVVLKGSGTPEIPLAQNVGDIVLFNPRAGQKFEWDGKEYRILDTSEVFLSGI